jgi:hypothetical protein
VRCKGERALLTLTFTAKVAASPRCVWRVLSDPASAANWLPFFCGWVGEPPTSISTLGALRFTSRLRGASVTAEVRVLEIAPGRVRLHARFGLFAFEARFVLRPEPGLAGATRIGLVVSVENEIAVVGGTLDRFEVRRLASELAESALGRLSAQAEESSRS